MLEPYAENLPLHWPHTVTYCHSCVTMLSDLWWMHHANRYVERPHLVFNEDGTLPVALTNGVKIGAQPGMQNDDQSYTLLRPLAV